MNSRKFHHHPEPAQARIPGPFAVEGRGNGRSAPSRDGARREITHLTRITVLIVSAIAFAYFARSVVVPVLLAWLGAIVLDPPVRWLGQKHVPKYIGSLLVVGWLF